MTRRGWRIALAEEAALVRLSARIVGGRFWYVLTVLPLGWTIFHVLSLTLSRDHRPFTAASAQNVLIATPLVVLAIALGVRIIAGEVDRRTLEIAYTVPGGAQRIWIAKLIATTGILVAAEAVIALATWVLLAPVPLSALYGALQAALVYLALSTAAAALFKSEITGALASVAVLVLNSIFRVDDHQGRFSPFFNPADQQGGDAADLFAQTLQNRIAMVLVIAACIALAFGRAERRERML